MRIRDKLTPDDRCIKLAEYLIDHHATVRATAQYFGISKSTVHKDITEKLPHINLPLYRQAIGILAKNKAERHLRGGKATKEKYYRLRIQKKLREHAEES